MHGNIIDSVEVLNPTSLVLRLNPTTFFQVYLESYTSILTVGQSELESFYGRDIVLADRTDVEQGCDEMLNLAMEHDVSSLTFNFVATTGSAQVY